MVDYRLFHSRTNTKLLPTNVKMYWEAECGSNPRVLIVKVIQTNSYKRTKFGKNVGKQKEGTKTDIREFNIGNFYAN